MRVRKTVTMQRWMKTKLYILKEKFNVSRNEMIERCIRNYSYHGKDKEDIHNTDVINIDCYLEKMLVDRIEKRELSSAIRIGLSMFIEEMGI